MGILAGNGKKTANGTKSRFYTWKIWQNLFRAQWMCWLVTTEEIISYSLEKYPEWSTGRHKVGKYRKIKTKVNKLNKNLNPIVCFFKETLLKYKDSENTKSERMKKCILCKH